MSENPIPLQDETLVQFIKRCFPTDDQSRIEYLEKHENKIKTWRDFTITLSELLADGDLDMTVYRSSTWAVCQEVLGNLGGHDLDYAQGRGGVWYSKFDLEKGTFNSITIRDIFQSLQIHYP